MNGCCKININYLSLYSTHNYVTFKLLFLFFNLSHFLAYFENYLRFHSWRVLEVAKYGTHNCFYVFYVFAYVCSCMSTVPHTWKLPIFLQFYHIPYFACYPTDTILYYPVLSNHVTSLFRKNKCKKIIMILTRPFTYTNQKSFKRGLCNIHTCTCILVMLICKSNFMRLDYFFYKIYLLY